MSANLALDLTEDQIKEKQKVMDTRKVVDHLFRFE